MCQIEGAAWEKDKACDKCQLGKNKHRVNQMAIGVPKLYYLQFTTHFVDKRKNFSPVRWHI
jgi:hypothetical protein